MALDADGVKSLLKLGLVKMLFYFSQAKRCRTYYCNEKLEIFVFGFVSMRSWEKYIFLSFFIL